MGKNAFTLIELLVILAIVGLLASIALPAYHRYIYAGRRSDAMNALLQLQLAQEKYRANHPAYAPDLATLGLSGNSVQGYYSIALAAPDPPSSYSATATPSGVQAGDTLCPRFVLNQEGPDMINTPNASACWKK